MAEKERRYGCWAGNPEGSPEDPTRCVEGVWERGRGAHQYQCPRPRGYGPDRLYCKQHAKKYGATSEIVTIWVARLEHARPCLWKAEVTETAKQYRVVSKSQVTKQPYAYLRDTIHKSGTGGFWPFADRTQAIEWLRERLLKHQAHLTDEIARATTHLVMLDELLAE